MPNVEELLAQMRLRIMELADRQALILNEDDREYIMGLKMLMEMEEKIDLACARRVGLIYDTTMQNAWG